MTLAGLLFAKHTFTQVDEKTKFIIKKKDGTSVKKNTLIDLAADFRLEKSSEYSKWYKQKHKATKNIKKSIYALPEISTNKVKKFDIISCPGCYPTSILLPLIPLVQFNAINYNEYKLIIY